VTGVEQECRFRVESSPVSLFLDGSRPVANSEPVHAGLCRQPCHGSLLMACSLATGSSQSNFLARPLLDAAALLEGNSLPGVERSLRIRIRGPFLSGGFSSPDRDTEPS